MKDFVFLASSRRFFNEASMVETRYILGTLEEYRQLLETLAAWMRRDFGPKSADYPYEAIWIQSIDLFALHEATNESVGKAMEKASATMAKFLEENVMFGLHLCFYLLAFWCYFVSSIVKISQDFVVMSQFQNVEKLEKKEQTQLELEMTETFRTEIKETLTADRLKPYPFKADLFIHLRHVLFGGRGYLYVHLSISKKENQHRTLQF